MATRKFLDYSGLQEYDELIKSVIESGDSAIESSLTSGTITVAEATHATSADSATVADSANAVAWANISGKPSTYTPSSHTHAISDVTDLQSTIDTINSEIDGSISGLSISGKVITYTKNDGTTGTITTQDTNTDTKVTQTVTTTDAEYTLLASNTANRTSTGTEAAIFAAGVTLNPADKSITATTFIGALSGNATSATTATSADSATKATQDASGNVITSTYETKTDASSKLAEAKTYADNAATTVKNDLLNGAGAAYDTLKELGDLIDTNVDAIEALETVAAGKADAEHTHAIADVTGLQTALDGKAASSHGTHVSYSTTAPLMDGTASVGSASTVARSDHRHPTDTTRAAQTDLDALETVVDGKADASHTHAISEVTNLQSTLDGKAASSHTHGNITNAGAIGTASGKAVITTTNGVLTTGTVPIASGGTGATTAAAALTNLGLTATAAELNIMDGVTATASEINKLDGLTATTTELNYVDGVTSNIQTQLDGKAASGHTHSDATTSAAGFMTAAMVTKLNGIATGATAVTVDSALSSSSTNPVQNKVVNSAISSLTSTVSTNTSSISSHSTAISNLQTAMAEIEEITSDEISALFA